MRVVFQCAVLTVGVCGLVRASLTASYTGQVQTFVVPQSGEYQITVYGASGGSGNFESGGAGAEVQAFFNLTLNESLSVYVGGQGASFISPFLGDAGAAGGGGGSFVVTSAGTPLIVAGGGGGGWL
jgi:hypothetical protein